MSYLTLTGSPEKNLELLSQSVLYTEETDKAHKKWKNFSYQSKSKACLIAAVTIVALAAIAAVKISLAVAGGTLLFTAIPLGLLVKYIKENNSLYESYVTKFKEQIPIFEAIGLYLNDIAQRREEFIKNNWRGKFEDEHSELSLKDILKSLLNDVREEPARSSVAFLQEGGQPIIIGKLMDQSVKVKVLVKDIYNISPNAVAQSLTQMVVSIDSLNKTFKPEQAIVLGNDVDAQVKENSYRAYQAQDGNYTYYELVEERA